MNQAQEIIEALTTGNPQHGFFGSVKSTFDASDKEAAELFDFAGGELEKRFKADGRKFGPAKAKMWLDSQSGRFLVDSLGVRGNKRRVVQKLKAAIAKVVGSAPWITKKAGQA